MVEVEGGGFSEVDGKGKLGGWGWKRRKEYCRVGEGLEEMVGMQTARRICGLSYEGNV